MEDLAGDDGTLLVVGHVPRIGGLGLEVDPDLAGAARAGSGLHRGVTVDLYAMRRISVKSGNPGNLSCLTSSGILL